mmetsp:Transcript_805/g.581  ORF Transcript_805/g.581 Transcript_805/m.581 type:complete len:93 (+) Transcript_805:150-428(+)
MGPMIPPQEDAKEPALKKAKTNESLTSDKAAVKEAKKEDKENKEKKDKKKKKKKKLSCRYVASVRSHFGSRVSDQSPARPPVDAPSRARLRR